MGVVGGRTFDDLDDVTFEEQKINRVQKKAKEELEQIIGDRKNL
jgi:hypothetical protein